MSNKIDKILAEISAGELFDKITILEIKKARISDKEKLDYIERELSSLNKTMKKYQSSKIDYQIQKNSIRNENIKTTNINTYV